MSSLSQRVAGQPAQAPASQALHDGASPAPASLELAPAGGVELVSTGAERLGGGDVASPALAAPLGVSAGLVLTGDGLDVGNEGGAEAFVVTGEAGAVGVGGAAVSARASPYSKLSLKHAVAETSSAVAHPAWSHGLEGLRDRAG